MPGVLNIPEHEELHALWIRKSKAEPKQEDFSQLSREELARIRKSEGGRIGGKLGSANRWAKTEEHEAQSRLARNELSEAFRQGRVKRWENPEAHRAHGERMRRYWASRREKKKAE